MRIAGTTLIAAVLLVAAGVAMADAAADQFLVKATEASLIEVELGKLAQKNAESTGVNALGARLARDHARIGKILAAASRDRGVVVPTALNGSQRQLIESLRAKTGPEFDSAYTELMVSNHAKVVALFTAMAQGDDPELSQLAKRALPLLIEDQRLAGSFDKLSARYEVQPVAGAK